MTGTRSLPRKAMLLLVVVAVVLGGAVPATALGTTQPAPPSVEVTFTPSSPVVGEPVTVSVSSNETIQSMTVAINGQEVASSNGPNATITFDEPGTHTVDVTVTGTDGETTTVTRGVGVNTNNAPTASLFLPSAVTQCEVFTAGADGSSDPDGPIVSFELDTDGDGTYEKRNDSGRFNHRFLSTGAHEMTVRVTDQSGATDTASDTVTIVEDACDDPVDGPDWSQVRANHRGTGHSTSVGPGEDGTIGASLSPTALEDVPDDLTITGPPALNDRVYLTGQTGDGGVVLAFNATGGEFAWVRSVDAEVSSPSVSESGDVVVTTDDGSIRSFDAATGEPRWESTLPDIRGEVTSDPVVRGKNIFVTALDTESQMAFLHLYDLADGSRQWSTELGSTDTPAVPPPVVARQMAYATDGAGTVFAISRNIGTVEWTYEADGSVRNSPVYDDAVLYVGTSAGTVHALDRATGTEIWTVETQGSVATAPSIADDTVYVGLATGRVTALDADTGVSKWSVDVSGVPTGIAIDGNGVVYASTTEGQVQAIQDGTSLWSETATDSLAGPAITDGLVATGDRDGTLHIACSPAGGAGDDAPSCDDISELSAPSDATTTTTTTTATTDDDDSGGSDGGMPGFGVGVALAAILAAGLLIWRTRD